MPCLGLFLSIVITFLHSIFHSTHLLLLLWLVFPLIPLLLISCTRYAVWDAHLEHGIPVSYGPSKCALVFWYFATSLHQLRTALNLAYNINIDINSVKCRCNKLLSLNNIFKIIPIFLAELDLIIDVSFLSDKEGPVL